MGQQVSVVLSAAEREQLAMIAADRNRPRKHVERARIVLASADRHAAQRVAQRIGVSRPTVWRWQQRFAESGVDGLLRDKTRKPGKPPIAAETTARGMALTPASALGHAHIGCDGLTRAAAGDSRIGDLCDFYCGTSALAEVSGCCHISIGHWVGSGIVASIKGGGACRMHGRGQRCLSAPAFEG